MAVHAVSLLDIPSGASAVVVGTGMIGLLVIQALKVAGCEQVIAIDIDPFKLKLAKELGQPTVCMPLTRMSSRKFSGLPMGWVLTLEWKSLGKQHRFARQSTVSDSVGRWGSLEICNRMLICRFRRL